MKKVLLLFSLSVCMLFLFACQSQEENITLLDNISTISISDSDGYGGINENYFTTIDRDTLIAKFENVLKSARAKKQKVDVTNEKPDYDVLIRYENGETHGLHIVLGDIGEESRVMYIGHENIGYNIPDKGTELLREIVDIK
ncbi:hypothetical protein SH601_14555 [Gracilibacillus sp. S3-1-1]|uniref:Uncharacterized protein n=1 Tax=Gracilibacillus pellucidus TaxID=3095368 RepID=A0ACC6M8J5_9BACI|nr:hypothetical protein [Gracilibacillus sp. S3-1-1]MDX8047206.1 hypothetical protein [Gracilibacillus sp. S3-1-1]